MSAEARPRRMIRTAVKVPVELTAVSSTSKSRSAGAAAPSTNGVSARQARVKGKGKRNTRSDDEGDLGGVDGMVALGEQSEATANVITGARGRERPTKSKSEKLYDIDFILTSPKSPLVNLDISDVLNYRTWTTLSPESRARLCKLLPPTAFGEQLQIIDELHPSRRHLQNKWSEPQPTGLQKVDEPMQVDEPSSSGAKADESTSPGERPLDPSFFNDPHFESAARTFQDHLYSGWLLPAHRKLVEKHLSGIRNGSLHAPWKDDVWERNHPEEDAEDSEGEDAIMHCPSSAIGTRTGRRSGKESKTRDFEPLVRKGFLKEGDIISFRHKFIALGITVEKDALISAIHPKSSALTLTASSGSTRDLPPTLLVPSPNGPSDLSALREMNVSAPAQLITALLDLDGRIARAQRPRLHTWKVLTVWRWSTDMGLQGVSSEGAALLERGGRECFGTLFYLRGEALDE